MAICNLFSELTKNTGNFLMFSQYTEDLTRYAVEQESYKVMPSKFIAMDVDYSAVKNKIDENNWNTTTNGLNSDIPKYLQNYFENGCAYLRGHYDIDEDNKIDWYPGITSNLFWRTLSDIGMISFRDVTEGGNGYVNEFRYIGDINIQSYDNKDGSGYGEIYCYIPTDECAYQYEVLIEDNEDEVIFENENDYLEGYPTELIGVAYPKTYTPERKYTFQYEDLYDQGRFHFEKDSTYNEKYNINTIIILYDIYVQDSETGDWIRSEMNRDIPLGIYFTGKFDSDEIGNPITKYITNESAFGMGTSYGLRICTRFAVTPQSMLQPIDVQMSNENYSAFCQVMTELSETHAKMNKVVENIIKNSQDIKDTLAVFKNTKVNVPYLKEINGSNYWFVNGKNIGIATVPGSGDCDCDPADFNEVQDAIDTFEIDLQ